MATFDDVISSAAGTAAPAAGAIPPRALSFDDVVAPISNSPPGVQSPYPRVRIAPPGTMASNAYSEPANASIAQIGQDVYQGASDSLDTAMQPGPPTTPTEAVIDSVAQQRFIPPGIARALARIPGAIPRWGANIERYLADIRNTPTPPHDQTAIDPHTGKAFTIPVPQIGPTSDERRMAMAQEPSTAANFFQEQLPPNRFDATVPGQITNAAADLPSLALLGPAAPLTLGLSTAGTTSQQLEDAGVNPTKAQIAGAGVGAAQTALFEFSPLKRALIGGAGTDAIEEAATPYAKRLLADAPKQFALGAGTEAAHQAARTATLGEPFFTDENLKRQGQSGLIMTGLGAIASLPRELGLPPQADARRAIDLEASLKQTLGPDFQADRPFLYRLARWEDLSAGKGMNPLDAAAAAGMTETDLRAALEIQGALTQARARAAEPTARGVKPAAIAGELPGPKTFDDVVAGSAEGPKTFDDVVGHPAASATTVNSSSQPGDDAVMMSRQDDANEPRTDRTSQEPLAGAGGTAPGPLGPSGDRALGGTPPDAGGGSALPGSDAGSGVPGGIGAPGTGQPAALAGSAEPGLAGADAAQPGAGGSGVGWAADFPEVVSHTDLPSLYRAAAGADEPLDPAGKSQAYTAAKAGDTEAAARVVESSIDPQKIEQLGREHPGAIVVPIHAEEQAGRNKLPVAYAQAISQIAGLEYSGDIVQTNRTFHTGASARQRLVTPARFDGPVQAGRDYIIADDVVTSGAAIAQLKHHIEAGGGRVVAATTLSTAPQHHGATPAVLPIRPQTIANIQQRFDARKLDAILKTNGIAPSILHLTDSQGRALLRFDGLNALRSSIAARRSRGGAPAAAGTIQPPEAQATATQPGPEQPVKPARPRRFRKPDVESVLLDAFDEARSHERDQMEREAGDTGIGPFTFHKKLPEEVEQFLEGHPDEQRLRRRVFSTTEDSAYAGGEDAMASLGEKYWQIAEAKGGRAIEQAVEHAEQSQDPQLQMNAAIWRNLPPASERKDWQMRDPKAIATGAKFSIQGHAFQIEEDADGFRVLKDGEDYPVLPADLVGKIPIDKGSITAAPAEEPDVPGGDFAPSEPPTIAASGGAGGAGGGSAAASGAAASAGGLHHLPPIVPSGATVTSRNVNPVQMPELFKLATELLGGQYPQATGRLRRWLGMFKYDGLGGKEIMLNRKALGESPEQLAATLAHEMGHLIDFLPDATLKRGNLLGRLATLRGFMKNMLPGSPFTNKQIRDELLAVTRWWKPYDPAATPKRVVKYRESARELYADALSVLLNSPGDLKRLAPTFFQMFFDKLDQKPEVRDAYFTLQDLLNGTPEQLAEARRTDMREMETKAEDVARARLKEREDGRQSFISAIRQALFDHSMPARTMDAKANPRTVPWDKARAASHILEELDMIHNPIHLMLKQARDEIVEPLEKEGVTRADLGDYLFHDRVGNGDRGGAGEQAQEIIMKMTGKPTWPEAKDEFLATAPRDPNDPKNLDPAMQDLFDQATSGKLNPHGYTPATSRQYLDGMKDRLGTPAYKILERGAKQLRDMLWDKTLKLRDAGVISNDLVTELAANKDHYAPFAVVKYFDNRVGAGIMKQVGTFEDIVNPADAALLKMASMIRMAKLNEAKLAVLDVMRKVFGAAAPTSTPVDQYHRARQPAAGKENLFHHIDGKLHVAAVDPYIARVFQSSDIGTLGRIADAISRPTYGVFHRLYVAFNAGWISREIIRGYKRTYKNAAVLHENTGAWAKPIQDALDVWRTSASMVRSIVPTLRYALGKDDPIIQQMLEHNAIGPTGRIFRPDIEDSTIYDRTLAQRGLLDPKRGPIARVLMLVPDAVETIGHFAASIPKIAMWDLATRAGKTGRERAYIVRNYGGLPNTSRRGLVTRLTNGLFLYSKITLEGWRADAEVAFNPRTAQGYWFRAFLIDFLPKIAMYGAAAGLMGWAMKKMMDDVPDYDKTKYIIVPLGAAENGKTVYIRLPHDRAHRTLAAALWKFMNGHGVQGLGESVSVAEDDLPSANPFWLMANKWKDYLAGKVPRDDFRGRDIIGKDQQAAGGSERLKPMLYWQLDQMGEPGHYLRIFLEGNKGETGTPKTGAEKIIESVPGLGAMVKFSDRGQMEDEWHDVDEQDKQHALLRLSMPKNTRAANVERYRLDRLGPKRLDDPQKQRRILLNGWSAGYQAFERKISAADAAGDKQTGEQLRGNLERYTDQMLKSNDRAAAIETLRQSMQLKPATRPAAKSLDDIFDQAGATGAR